MCRYDTLGRRDLGNVGWESAAVHWQYYLSANLAMRDFSLLVYCGLSSSACHNNQGENQTHVAHVLSDCTSGVLSSSDERR